jgi:hypothetical protein
METKHTPGPWINQGSRVVDLPGRQYAATICTLGTSTEIADPLANAQLIAAAPDLLEALQECITEEGAACLARDDAYQMRKRLYTINTLARVAIAKATGN